MTLNDITVGALDRLDRGHDAQTLEMWRDKLTMFANDALTDLAHAIKPVRTEKALILLDGTVDANAFERDCIGIVSITADGRDVPFVECGTSGVFKVKAEGSVAVTYAYVPKRLSSPSDVPELPERFHPLIVIYVVARERMSGDISTQKGFAAHMRLYETMKAEMLKKSGSADAYGFINRW